MAKVLVGYLGTLALDGLAVSGSKGYLPGVLAATGALVVIGLLCRRFERR